MSRLGLKCRSKKTFKEERKIFSVVAPSDSQFEEGGYHFVGESYTGWCFQEIGRILRSLENVDTSLSL